MIKQTHSSFTGVLEQLGQSTEVLVVDDSVVCRKALVRALTRYEFDVMEVSSGAEALELLARRTPELVLTDVHMPEMDGYELCKRIKATPGARDVPVIFVTTEGDSSRRLEGFDAGGSDYITKGADEMEIVARVRAHVELSCARRDLLESRDRLAKQVDEIAQQNRLERELRQRLEDQQSHILQTEKMASIGQLAAGVAHEINNPIGFISSNLGTLRDYADDLTRLLRSTEPMLAALAEGRAPSAEQALAALSTRKAVDLEAILDDLGDLIDESADGAARVRGIVADLRDFSHVDAPDAGPEDLHHLLDKTINVAASELKYKAEIERRYGELPPVVCFGGKLSQVFLNLLVNAAQAMTDRGTITITTARVGDDAVVTVRDTGVGIAEEKLGRIFDPFYTTKDVGHGTGLGLHLSYKIVEAHGGSIDVVSRAGEGATFRVTLPLAGPPSAQEPPRDQAA